MGCCSRSKAKRKPCRRKKEGTEQGRQMIKHRQFTHKVMSERIRMDLIQSIKVSSDNFQGWGKKRRLKKKKYDNFQVGRKKRRRQKTKIISNFLA
jgi:hypothetical protein